MSNSTDREIRITNSTAGDGGDLELIAGSAGGGNTMVEILVLQLDPVLVQVQMVKLL